MRGYGAADQNIAIGKIVPYLLRYGPPNKERHQRWRFLFGLLQRFGPTISERSERGSPVRWQAPRAGACTEHGAKTVAKRPSGLAHQMTSLFDVTIDLMRRNENAPSVEYFEHPSILEHDGDQIPRFVIPEDEVVASDYRFVQDRLAEAAVTDPAIVGATAFGSTTKGRSDPKDLDLTVFVDTDRLDLQMRPDLSSGMVSFSNWSGFAGADRRDGPEQRYRALMQQLFSSPEGPLTTLPINAEAFPISHEFLRRLAGFEIGNAQRLARYRELSQAGGQLTQIDNLTDWATVSTDPETLQSIAGLADMMSDDEKRHGIDVLSARAFLGRIANEDGGELARARLSVFSEIRLASSLPVRLFNLALTPGLAPYRRTFLEGLAQTPDPRLAYTYFIDRLRAFENSSKHPRDTSKIPYPATLSDALEVYG